jgi:hypothetical protein
MLDQTPHQTGAMALEETACVEVDRHDISVLLERKPMAGMDMLTVLGRQFHASQQLVRVRANRNPNEVIEEEATFGQRLADSVARFGGSWTFIMSFGAALVIYTTTNVTLGRSAWDLPVHPAQPVSLDAGWRPSSAGHHDEPEPQDPKDRLRGELDFDVNRRAESRFRIWRTNCICWTRRSATSRICWRWMIGGAAELFENAPSDSASSAASPHPCRTVTFAASTERTSA